MSKTAVRLKAKSAHVEGSGTALTLSKPVASSNSAVNPEARPVKFFVLKDEL